MDSSEPAAAGGSFASLAERGEKRRYRKGTILIHEGERNDTLFYVVSGRVKVYSVDERGREIVYGHYGANETIGEMCLDGGPRSASVVILEPTVCVMITRQRLIDHIRVDPDFALLLISKIIERARIATRNARSMALLDVYGRVVQLLESLASPQDDGTRVITERLTHADIASRVGCSREMVSRLLKDLRAGNYLSIDGKTWVLPGKPLPSRW